MKLDDAKQDHKELKNVKVVAHITKCFMYAMKSNKNQPEKLAKALKKCTLSFFGFHDECGEGCKVKQLENPTTYTYANFPRRKSLQPPAR